MIPNKLLIEIRQMTISMLGISTEICIKRNHSWVLDQARIEGLITVVLSLETWNEIRFYRQTQTF